MDSERKERLLRDLKVRLRDAKLYTREITDETWAELESAGLEGMLRRLETLPRMTREYRQMSEALVLLHPYREAWKIVWDYRKEILDAETEEQEELLRCVLETVSASSRIRPQEIAQHIYVFWPVREQAAASSL